MLTKLLIIYTGLPFLCLCMLLILGCEALSTGNPSHLATRTMPPSRNKKIVSNILTVAQNELKKFTDPEKAKIMQGYCKTTMPMYGIQKPDRAKVEKIIHQYLMEQKITLTGSLYVDCVQGLWSLPNREEKYLAIDFALKYKEQIVWENLPLYENFFIRDHEDIMWWDFVDPIAVNLVGRVALQNKSRMEPLLRQWINDENMWIRRTAILAQLKHKQDTNGLLLFELCRSRMHEKEFFIRKAIGWALREYGKTNPDSVVKFMKDEKANLSGLSYREGSRILVKDGRM